MSWERSRKSSGPNRPAARWRRVRCAMGWARSATDAKRPNGSATTYVEKFTLAESRKNHPRRVSPTPLQERLRSPQELSEAGAAEQRGARCGVGYSGGRGVGPQDPKDVTRDTA